MCYLKLLVCSVLAFGIWVCATTNCTAEDAITQDASPVSLTALAYKADLVAVAQVKDTDYVFTRSFPSEGSAFLKILISYKRNNPDEEIIEVYEKGLHLNECYFESPTVFEEGRRYLVFLRIDPGDPEAYRGLPEGCALEIFVTDRNRYALKYPLEGFQLTDELDKLAKPMEFRDNYALVSNDSLEPAKRDYLLSKGLIVSYQDKFKYTRGIELTAVRKLINSEALESKPDW